MDTARELGFIGTGIMGEPMALRLLAADKALCAYDKQPQRTRGLRQAGARIGTSPRAVAAGVDLLFIMVMDATEVRDVLFGSEGAAETLRAGATVVCMSSIAPAAVREIARELEARAIACVDAPVSGGRVGAADGTLSFMVGGSDAAVKQVLPLLALMGKTITHVGAVGSGQLAKMANQIIVTITRAAIGEALTLVRQQGGDPRMVVAALEGGLADSANLRDYAPRLFDRDEPMEFGSVILKKDICSAAGIALQAGLELPLTSITAERYRTFRRD
jgi:2-hydroxy-3-oxopropionate reductase